MSSVAKARMRRDLVELSVLSLKTGDPVEFFWHENSFVTKLST